MKRTILIFGVISGAISSVLMLATVPFEHKIGYNKGLIVGYTAIVLSFLLVYFGMRSYRDNVGNGQITFSKAFAIGICITLISCVFYVVTWEIVYFNFMPNFWDTYATAAVEKLKAAGATAPAIRAQLDQINKYKELYKSPVLLFLMTFIEPFPVGLVITLISAAVVRKKPQLQQAQSPLHAS